MSRSVGQLIALSSILVLIIVLVAYQYFPGAGLKSDVLDTPAPTTEPAPAAPTEVIPETIPPTPTDTTAPAPVDPAAPVTTDPTAVPPVDSTSTSTTTTSTTTTTPATDPASPDAPVAPETTSTTTTTTTTDGTVTPAPDGTTAPTTTPPDSTTTPAPTTTPPDTSSTSTTSTTTTSTSTETTPTTTAPTTPPAPVTPATSSLPENRAQSSHDENGILVLNYLVLVGSQVVLDGLQTPAVASISTPVLWSPPSSVTIADPQAARTSFYPAQEGQITISLSVNGELKSKYSFDVVGSTLFAADVNHDGLYTFNPDLINLLRIWNDLADLATPTLAGVLSRLITQ